MTSEPHTTHPDSAREAERSAIAAAAADIDAVASRTATAAKRLEVAGAEPNLVVAARRAVTALAEAAAALRRDGLLEADQQRLL